MRFRLLALGAVLALLPAPALAQTNEQRAAAEALFQQGRKLVESGDFADACPKLAESQRLDPGLGTMLWLADCYENNGQTASAWVEFAEAASLAAQKSDPRAPIARKAASRLEPKLSRLMVVVPPTALTEGLELRRDGLLIGQAQWSLPVPIDPGVHTVSASAPGHKGWSTTAQIAGAGPAVTVVVPPLEEMPVEPPTTPLVPAPTVTLPAPSEEPPVQSGSGRSPQRLAGIALGSAGVASLVTGTVLSFVAKSTYDASNRGPCNAATNVCTQHGLDDRASASAEGTAATATMIAGGALLVGGAVLFFTAPKASRPSTVVTSVALTGVPRGAGCAVAVGGSW